VQWLRTCCHVRKTHKYQNAYTHICFFVFLISTLTARASMSHNLRSRCGYRVFFLFSFAIVKASTRPGRNGTRARLSNHNIAN